VDSYAGPDPGQVLMLSSDGGGPRHFLAGLPVHAGSVLEVLLEGGRWLRVRYEWTARVNEEPTFYLALGRAWETNEDQGGPVAKLQLPSDAALRWAVRG